MTGPGERLHLMSPSINLDTHITDIVNVIKREELSDLVLVGHSYGGVVVTGVADTMPDRITSLVYLDAFVPENDQSLVSLLPPGAPPPKAAGDYTLAPLPAAVFRCHSRGGGLRRRSHHSTPHRLLYPADQAHRRCRSRQKEILYHATFRRRRPPLLRCAPPSAPGTRS